MPIWKKKDMTTIRQSTHELKSWPEYFRAIVTGDRRHELRKNDRDYKVGDIILLREYDPKNRWFTGSKLQVEVTSITSTDVPCAVSEQGLHPDYCILSIRLVDPLARGAF